MNQEVELEELTVTGYETEEDYRNEQSEHIITTTDVDEAANKQEEYENADYYLVTTTNNDGKLR